MFQLIRVDWKRLFERNARLPVDYQDLPASFASLRLAHLTERRKPNRFLARGMTLVQLMPELIPPYPLRESYAVSPATPLNRWPSRTGQQS